MANTDNRPKKHVPQRTCIACREVNDKRSLIRIVKTPEGVRIDPSGKLAGRGAYLHESKDCWEKALKRGTLARSLKAEISSSDLEMLQAFMEKLQ